MQLPEQSKSSRSEPQEQWSVVELADQSMNDERHEWRFVMFKNGLGELRPGLKCNWCTRVRIMSKAEMRALDQRGGHGGRY